MAKLKQADRLAEPAKVEESPSPVQAVDEFTPEKKPIFRSEQGPPLAFHEKVGVDDAGNDIIEPKSMVVCSNIKSYQAEEYANLCERSGYELCRTDITDTGRYTLWFRRCRP
jgi:hypothetical protein